MTARVAAVEAETWRARARRRWAWVIPWLVIWGVQNSGRHLPWGGVASLQVRVAVWSGLGFAAGVAWQLLYRRDLVDRLAGWALAFAVFVGARPLTGADVVTNPVSMWCLVDIVVGLVITEWWLRNQPFKRGWCGDWASGRRELLRD